MFGGIGLYTNNNLEYYRVWIHSNNQWYQTTPYVYINGKWEIVGGAQTFILPLQTKNSDDFTDSNNKTFYVRKEEA